MHTLWSNVLDLYGQPNVRWAVGDGERPDRDGTQCYCVGNAIAYVLTGGKHDMYRSHELPVVDTALTMFADHVDARMPLSDSAFYTSHERVWRWNDYTAPELGGRQRVMAALRFLHRKTLAKCVHPHAALTQGVCQFCDRTAL